MIDETTPLLKNVVINASVKDNDYTGIYIEDCETEYRSLSYYELQPYVNDPFWIKIRLICRITLIIIFLGMIASIITKVYFAVLIGCAPVKPVNDDSFLDNGNSANFSFYPVMDTVIANFITTEQTTSS